MCPYYLDGDLTELESPVGDTRCHRGLSSAVAVATVQFSRAAERAPALARSTRGPTGERRSLKTQQQARPQPSALGRTAREAPRPLADARRQLGRPGPVDVLAARPVAAGSDRGDEGHDLPHGAVPHRPRRAP